MSKWSIQQAVDEIFNIPGFTIAKGTIQDWMRERRDKEGNLLRPRVFVPFKRAARRDPDGCKLDMADLTTLMVLRSLSLVGVEFRYLSYGDTPGREYMKFHTGWMLPKERDAFDRDLRKHGRPIQTFIELVNYRCLVRVSHSIIGTDQRIGFFRGSKAESWMLDSDETSWNPITYIGVYPLYEYIAKRVPKNT